MSYYRITQTTETVVTARTAQAALNKANRGEGASNITYQTVCEDLGTGGKDVMYFRQPAFDIRA